MLTCVSRLSSFNPYSSKIFYPLPDDEILALSKLKAFANDKLDVTQNFKFASHGVETLWERENAGHQHFSSFYNIFKSLFPLQGPQ